MIVFTEEKKFTREKVQELFLSVGWISGQYLARLYKALMNSSTVFTAWDGDRLVGLVLRPLGRGALLGLALKGALGRLGEADAVERLVFRRKAA